MRITKEPYSDALLAEVLPLAQKCWEESTTLKGESCAYHGMRNIQVDPDVETYRSLGGLHRLLVLTLRDDESLVGYAIAAVTKSAHHQMVIWGHVDTFYIEPDYRSHARALAVMVQQELKQMGAATIGWLVSPNSPLHQLLIALGFTADEVMMEKLTCASQVQ